MSDPGHPELMILVERIVRPIRAPHARRMAMRQELLAHVEQIHAEELERGALPASALARTQERFGHPDEIRASLQKSVPRTELFTRWADRLCVRRSGETPLQFAARFGLMIGGTHLVLLTVCLLVASFIQGRPLQAYVPEFLALLCGAFAANCFAITWLGLTVVDPFINRPQEVAANRRRLALCTLGASACLVLTFVGLTAWGTGEIFVLARTTAIALAASAILFPAVCMAFIHERRQAQPWESLDLTAESSPAAIL